MRWRTVRFGRRLAMAGLLLLAAGVSGQEDEDPQFLRDLTDAYITFGKANRAREAGERAEALLLFENALAQYRRLHHLYPDLQSEIIQYRIADCANQVEALRQGAGPDTAAAPAAEAPGTPPETVGAEAMDEQRIEILRLLDTTRSVGEQLQERQAAVGAQLARSRDAAAGRAERRRAQQEELQKLTAQLEEARARLNADPGAGVKRPGGGAEGDADVRRVMALGLRRLQQFDEAAALLRESLAADPGNAALHADLGALWLEAGQGDESRKELEQALSLDPSLGEAHLNLARVLAGGSPDERAAARSHYRRALDLGMSPDRGLQERLDAP